MFCREVMLVYLERSSVKIGGHNKTIEMDESKFGRRKYHRGHPVKGQWVFVGVERESGETFLVPVKDRTADTLMAIICDLIENGTTVISDCWGAYHDLGSWGYTHRTSAILTPALTQIPSRLRGVTSKFSWDSTTGGRTTNTMFAARCKAQGIPPFIQFLHLVANTDWSQCCLPSSSGRAT
jgi:transposase-like protein